MLATGQTLQAPGLTDRANAETVPVTNGAAIAVGETILIDAERMLTVDIAGNNLIVKRGFDGSTLAELVLGPASAVAVRTRAELVLVQVVPWPPYVFPDAAGIVTAGSRVGAFSR